ncbi:MAG: hypothetical protein KDD82_29130, partial [Planctomycetes bacterium]|nr:hypothetical protein [Planctomycetota bacterium]
MSPFLSAEAALGRFAGRLRARARRERPQRPERLLLIACHWVGDSLWATQVLAPLAERYGRDALWVAAPARTACLWRAQLPAARVLVLEHVISDRRRESWSPAGFLAEVLDVRRLEFDAVVDLTGNRFSALLAASLGAWCCGPDTHPWARLYDVATPSPPSVAGAPEHLACRPFRAALPLLGALPKDLQPTPPPCAAELGARVRARLGLAPG